ncbi:MAG: hypothetical protein GEV12_09195 [Micromonosporaceae bacterium]|nr:hypothetical protein [Micromonosporaceae bacterium]
MRHLARVAVAFLAVVALSFGLAPAAQADTQRAESEPNGHIWLTSSSGSTTDRDKDGNFNTLTQADKGIVHYSVFNQAEFSQPVHITVSLDGPGTAQDAVLLDEVFDLGPRCEFGGTICTDSQQGTFRFMVSRKDWPAGGYSLSVTGSGSESVTGVSTFTVAY